MFSIIYNLSSIISGNSVLPALVLLFVIVDIVLIEALRSYFYETLTN